MRQTIHTINHLRKNALAAGAYGYEVSRRIAGKDAAPTFANVYTSHEYTRHERRRLLRDYVPGIRDGTFYFLTSTSSVIENAALGGFGTMLANTVWQVWKGLPQVVISLGDVVLAGILGALFATIAGAKHVMASHERFGQAFHGLVGYATEMHEVHRKARRLRRIVIPHKDF